MIMIGISMNCHRIYMIYCFKDILEGILVYARYHAKAIGDGNE